MNPLGSSVAFGLAEGEVDGEALDTAVDLLRLVDGDTAGDMAGLEDSWFDASQA
jgi:hypothetical protein